ncbi:MAG: hypothetical protein NC822_07485, partial [Candidatus Omnitrophica bacterium]|nr:hypothetical protein [Candidatus Omnitrophota bacterium]
MLTEIIVNIDRVIRNYSLLGIILSFLGGIVVSLSPCILPLLPVILGIIGTIAIKSKIKVSLISLVFLCGLISNYLLWSIISSLLGILIVKTINVTIFNTILGIILIILGLSIFDIIHIPILNIKYNRKPHNIISLFTLGVIASFTMLPCALPILGTILSLIALKRNIFWGIIYILAFALGYSIVIFSLGYSTSIINK